MFGADVPITDIMAELYIQNATGSLTRLISDQPVYNGSTIYGYQIVRESAYTGYIRVEFGNGGLAYYASSDFSAIDNTWKFRLFLYKTEKFNKFYDHTGDDKLNHLWMLGLTDTATNPSTTQVAGYIDRTSTQPTHTTRMNYDGDLYTTNITTSSTLSLGPVANIALAATTTGVTIKPQSGTPLTIKDTDQTTSRITASSVGMITTIGASSGFAATSGGTLAVDGISTLTGATTINNVLSIKTISGTPLTITDTDQTTPRVTASSVGMVTATGVSSGFTAATGGTLSINGTSTLAVNGAALTSTSATFALLAVPTTITFGAAATSMTIAAVASSVVNLGASNNTGTTNLKSGTLTISGATSIAGGLTLNTVGTLDSTVASSTLFSTPTTVSFAAAATALTIGATTGSTTIRTANFYTDTTTTLNHMKGGALTLGDNAAAGRFGALTLTDGSATTANSATMTVSNAASPPYLTINQGGTNAYMSLATSGAERIKINYSGASGGIAINNIVLSSNPENNADTQASLSLNGSSNGAIGVRFNTGTYSSKIIFGTDHIFHFGGDSDTKDGAALKCGTITGAVWNDFADFIEVESGVPVVFGKVYIRNKSGKHSISTNYCEKGIVGIASDTYGIAVGEKQVPNQIPMAVAGFALAYVDKVYDSGTALTSGKKGNLTKMSLIDKILHPERLIATFYKKEAKESITASQRTIKVDNRVWVRVR
jgi:hypothetical protein